jgi:hypothetical protein
LSNCLHTYANPCSNSPDIDFSYFQVVWINSDAFLVLSRRFAFIAFLNASIFTKTGVAETNPVEEPTESFGSPVSKLTESLQSIRFDSVLTAL